MSSNYLPICTDSYEILGQYACNIVSKRLLMYCLFSGCYVGAKIDINEHYYGPWYDKLSARPWRNCLTRLYRNVYSNLALSSGSRCPIALSAWLINNLNHVKPSGSNIAVAHMQFESLLQKQHFTNPEDNPDYNSSAENDSDGSAEDSSSVSDDNQPPSPNCPTSPSWLPFGPSTKKNSTLQAVVRTQIVREFPPTCPRQRKRKNPEKDAKNRTSRATQNSSQVIASSQHSTEVI